MDEQEISLQELWQTIWKRAWLVVGLTVCAMIVAYFASSAMTPIYEAETSFMVKTKGGNLVLPIEDLGLMGTGANMTRNYVEVLKSRTVLDRALDRVGLEPEHDPVDAAEVRQAITAQVIAQTDAIRVKVQLADRRLAADLANALVDVLIEHNRDMNQSATRTAREYLADQLEVSTIQLRGAEERMLALKAGKRILEPSAEAQAQIKRVVDLETKKAEAEVSLGETKARLSKIREQLGGMTDTVVSSQTVVEDPVVAGYRTRLADLEIKLAAAREKYTEQHPEVVKITAEMAEVKASLNSAVAKVVGTQVSSPNPMREQLLKQVVEAETQMASARAQVDALAKLIATEEARLGTLPQKELDLARVTRDLDVAQQIYIMLRTRYEEMRITEQMQTSDIWRIDPAAIPTSPVKPRKLLNTAVAGVLGVFVGVGMAFVMEFADTSMKSAEDVEAVLGLPILGAIPRHVGPGVESVTEDPGYYRARPGKRARSKNRE